MFMQFWYVLLAFLCAVLMLWEGAPLWLFCVALVAVLGLLAAEQLTGEEDDHQQ